MQLRQYPQAIASLEETLLQSSLEVEIYREGLSLFDGEIELALSRDAALKNEQLRRARRLQLQQEEGYLDVKNRLKEAQLKRERFSIDLARMKNEFSVAKLEARQAIASLEAAA